MRNNTLTNTMIIVAILAIIAAVALPPLLVGDRSRPSEKHTNYDGWTYVTSGPFNHHYYMKHIPDQHVTIWYDDGRGGWTIVKD